LSDTIWSKSFKGGSWLALFKIFSQFFSWLVTIIVARVLVPGDYGLFAIATIFTGYAELFSELGLGNAIIQRKTSSQAELSSVFWFSSFVSGLLVLSCFPIAYITAKVFSEPRVIPLTESMALIFLFMGFQIVPLSLLKKELEFKTVGKIDLGVAFVSGIGMILLSYFGAGVWTLVGGFLLRSIARLIMVYYRVKWYPSFHFNFKEAKAYIKFGLIMSFGRSLFYIWEQSDRFFAGRAWNPDLLGIYAFALQLAQIPTEKIVTLINQVSFPALSKLQDDKAQFNKFYLNSNKITAFLVIPLFFGGFLVGEDLIKIILNEKWYPMITIFKYLCLTQIFMSINAINNFAHAAQGRPMWGVYYHIAGVLTMPVSFYFAVKYGLNAIIIPWMTVFVILTTSWIIITIKTIGVSIIDYVNNLRNPILGAGLMLISLTIFRHLITPIDFINENYILRLSISLVIGGISYVGYQWFSDREFIFSIKRLLK
jgi:O-antigen/teichoic acid export membrane protein